MTTTAQACTHHWKIESEPIGGLYQGQCRKCREERTWPTASVTSPFNDYLLVNAARNPKSLLYQRKEAELEIQDDDDAPDWE